MKILVFSDSHGHEQEMLDVIEEHKDVNLIVFSGDGGRDFEEVLAGRNIFPYGSDTSVRSIMVAGNCDRCSMEPVRIIDEIEGIRFLITHGHAQNAHFGYAGLIREAKEKNCAVVIFGHTHRQCLEEHDGITLFNPGSIRSGRNGSIEIKDGHAAFELKNV